ncbi:MAG: SRPBCC family protein [Bacteroidetes bacterium]|nr:SRPBCC family protein [Bacteroidota bacterium]
MKIYSLHSQQQIPISLHEAWDFFSSPANLKTMTPPNIGFEITSAFSNEKMYNGQIITYIVKPLAGIPLTWVTEITHVQEPHYFVDEQRFGPYALWHHKHFFKEIKGGVEMTDHVHYALPLGILGRFANTILVENQLKQIFDFRFQKMKEIFGEIK